MTTTWIDFRELRAKLRFADVLASYNVTLKVKGDRATGFCPLPGHQGQRRSPSFSANLAKGIFQCFGCGAKGNVLDFTCFMDGLDPANTANIRTVALKLQDRFGQAQNSVPPAKRKASGNSDNNPSQVPSASTKRNGRVVNAPIDFELKSLDPLHPYLLERGLIPETINHFGLGFCKRGLMAGRIAIPLHNLAGQLVGYAGRIADDAVINDDNPKYRLPGERERDGIVYEFKKSLFLYNAHRLTAPLTNLVIVEGFPSVWWLWQHGYPDVVALMGASCSPEQIHTIVELVKSDGNVWIFMDGDKAGERCATSMLIGLSPHRAVRWIKITEGQPTDITVNDLHALLPEIGDAGKE